jgi:hypothetical protein
VAVRTALVAAAANTDLKRIDTLGPQDGPGCMLQTHILLQTIFRIDAGDRIPY